MPKYNKNVKISIKRFEHGMARLTNGALINVALQPVGLYWRVLPTNNQIEFKELPQRKIQPALFWFNT